MLVVMDKSTQAKHLSQPLQNKKQFKIAVSFLSGCNGIFNVRNKNNRFIFISVSEGAEYNVVTVPLGA